MAKQAAKPAQVQETEKDVFKPLSEKEKEQILGGHRLIISAVQSQIVLDKDKVAANEILDRMKDERTSVANQLLRAAQAFTIGKKFNLSAWETWCQQQETFIKSPEAGEYKVEKIPHVWSQAKSNIKRAYERAQVLPTAKTSVESLHREAMKITKEATVQAATKGDVSTSGIDELADPEMVSMVNVVATMFNAADDKGKETIKAGFKAYVENLKAINKELAGTPKAPIQAEGLQSEPAKTGTA